MILLFVLGASLHADERDNAARRHFFAGQAAYGIGHYAEALGEFTAGYALSPRPEFLYNIALAYKNLGKKQEAIDACRRFLAVAPNNQYAPAARALLATLVPEETPAQPTSPSEPPQTSPPETPVPTAAPEQTNALTQQPPPPAAPRKKRTWVWAVVGASVAAAIAIGVGLGVGLSSPSDSYPSTPLPPVDLRH